MVNRYSMRISRLTVDKLGVKLYDRVSAVIAELISNSYDADATKVTVRAPMGEYLATRSGGMQSDKGLEIVVEDNGFGMSPNEVQEFFLVVGAERRNDSRRGSTSPRFKRKVMGRKGVGKLAPFGICKVIEVISSGGSKVSRMEGGTKTTGFETSHIVLNYDDIIAEGDPLKDDYKPIQGHLDGTLREKSGTKIILTNFNYRRVPKLSVLARQISQRFGISSVNWKVTIEDSMKKPCDPSRTRDIGQFDIETMPNTRINFDCGAMGVRRVIGPGGTSLSDLEPGFHHESDFYDVTGWIAYSKEPYKDELMAGVRIYCRGKIAAKTSLFGRGAGFTGEHSVRSYLVGELHADWLDEAEDLIQTDRRDILWSDELAAAFQEWGQHVVKRIGTLARDPSRKSARDLFFETGDVENRIRSEYPSKNVIEIRNRANDLAEKLGRTVNRDDASDPDVVGDLVDLSILLAPHVTLDEVMRTAVKKSDTPLSVLSTILRTARISELSSFGRIAEKRIDVIERLEKIKSQQGTQEHDLQQLIENAPWLIDPEWAPVTANRSLMNLKKAFEDYYKKHTGRSIFLTQFEASNKRPDFVLTSQDGVVQIVEIKRPLHSLTNVEMSRIVSYYQNMERFLNDPNNAELARSFNNFHITLVCDDIGLSGSELAAYNGFVSLGRLSCISWSVFLAKTENVHQDFLVELRRQKSLTVNNGS